MLQTVERWDYFELELQAAASGNPCTDVTLEADFIHHHRTVHVAGFYDGDNEYKIRFMPDVEGDWHFVTHSNVRALDDRRGSFECVPPPANNHGPVRVIDHAHFAYADGTPYHPIGTTCYVWNLQGDELEEQTLATLRAAPFNKVRMCVFPKRYLFNFNEPPCYPFAGEVKRPWDPANLDHRTTPPPLDFWDFTRFNPEYFRRLEKRILDLRALGIEADLILFHPYDVGAWGFDRMPAEVNDRYLTYLVARLSSFRNLWWSFANEYDLFPERTLQDWDHYMQLVQHIDPYNHLRSIHNCMAFYDHTQPWITHCSVQSQDLHRVPLWLKKYGKPVVVDECGYEGDISMVWGDLSPEEMVLRFWVGFTLGGSVGHGETYVNPEGVLWWSKGGQLHGESAPRIAFLRQIFEQAPAAGLTPLGKLDNETINLLEKTTSIFDQSRDVDRIIAEGRWNVEAGGYCGNDYFLFYFGMRQPGSRNFNLSPGSFRIDVIDTWNMTIARVADAASGQVRIALPRKKYLAIRIEKNST